MRFDDANRLVRATVGGNIREFRKADKTSQTSFALMINLDRSFLSAIENGKANPTIGQLTKIASGLDRQLPDLFRGLEGASPERLAERLIRYGAVDLSEIQEEDNKKKRRGSGPELLRRDH